MLGTTISIPVEELLAQSSASVEGCWQLIKGKGIAIANKILDAHVPSLMRLSCEPSQYQQRAACITTQAKILQAILAMHNMDLAGRLQYCQEALSYARISEDTTLLASAMMYLAYTYTYCPPLKPRQAVHLYLEALHVPDNHSPLLKTDIYIGLAAAYAQCDEHQRAFEAIGLGKESFPDYPEKDPSYFYADCGIAEIYEWEGCFTIYLSMIPLKAEVILKKQIKCLNTAYNDNLKLTIVICVQLPYYALLVLVV